MHYSFFLCYFLPSIQDKDLSASLSIVCGVSMRSMEHNAQKCTKRKSALIQQMSLQHLLHTKPYSIRSG